MEAPVAFWEEEVTFYLRRKHFKVKSTQSTNSDGKQILSDLQSALQIVYVPV